MAIKLPRSGITASTPKNIMVDAGVLVANYGIAEKERILGATSGGNSVAYEREMRVTEADGARGDVMGLKEPETINIRLTVNLLEHTAENLRLSMGHAEMTDESDFYRIKPRLDVLEKDYFENIALCVRKKNTSDFVIYVLENALADGEIETEFEDKNDAVTEVQFTAHYDPANVEDIPFYILYPKESVPELPEPDPEV